MSDSRQRLHRARSVVLGATPPGTWRTAGYAVYVAVLMAVVNAFPLAQAMTRVIDLEGLGAALSTTAGRLGLLGALALVTLGAWRLGRVHGPVVPDLPYVDLIVTSPIDRATTTAPWWRLSLLGAVVGAALLGAVITGSLAYVGAAPWSTLLVGLAGGAGLGGLVAWVWLHGQSGEPSSDGRRGWRTGAALARLTVPDLRSQAVGSRAMRGAALMGDLRAARLVAAAPRSRGRSRLLRAGSPIVTMARRDLLGLQRDPGRATLGAVGVVAGTLCLAQRAASSAIPLAGALVGAALLQWGFRMWCEGLRLHGDTAGTAPLLGLAPRAEALTHLLVPTTLYAATVALTGGAAYLLMGLPWGATLWPLALLGILAGAALVGAYRGLAPMPIFSPDLGIPALIAWSSGPAILAWALTGLLTELARTAMAATASATGGAIGHLATLGSWSLTATALFLSWGLGRQRRQFDAHRG